MAEHLDNEARDHPAVPHAHEHKEFREYLAVLRRRSGLIIVVTALLFAVAILVALALPAIYRSTATILVQEQEVPPDLVRSTITSYADERIQVIGQQVMTRAVLLQLADKYDLYEKYRTRARTDEIVDMMRKDIKISTIDASISDRSSGRRVNSTIAFNISYDSPSADSAQKVVSELVVLYLNENAKARQQSAAETTAFLAQEAARLAAQIQDIEGNLAAFKRRHLGRMPDSSGINMQLAERTDSDLSRIDREISMLQDRRVALEGQLMLVSPYASALAGSGDRILPPEQRLQALRAQYASASAIYGAEHPDLRRLQREIAKISGEADPSTPTVDVSEKLKGMETELAALKERYSESHPDVQKLQRAIAALKVSGVGDAPAKASDRMAARAPKPDNPNYVAITSQIESTRRQIDQLTLLRDETRAKQRIYDARLLQIPDIEREYRDLTRDYDNAQARYREVKAKQMQAEIGQELEKNRKAERFSLGEPPSLPETPHHPNRLQLLLAGFAASLGGGIGLAWLRDALDPSIKGPLELARIATVPILTAIPYIETRREHVLKQQRGWITVALGGLLAAGFLWGIHHYLRPLSNVVDSLARRLPF